MAPKPDDPVVGPEPVKKDDEDKPAVVPSDKPKDPSKIDVPPEQQNTTVPIKPHDDGNVSKPN